MRKGQLGRCWYALLVVSLLFLAAHTLAAEPPIEPFPRIETGQHIASINSIATDAGKRFLATASEDKTVRIWDLHGGTLLQTLRPPYGGKISEGKLTSVAMSPDGNYVATGGQTSLWDNTGTSIYIFQRTSGRLVKRILDIPNYFDILAWSPDGRYLAVGQRGKEGVRVFRSEDFSLVGKDVDYGGGVYGLDFDSKGRMVTSSFDGSLRLYQIVANGLRLLVKKTARGGEYPFHVRFSPDGTRIAVGFRDAANVGLFSAESLDFVAAPTTQGLGITGNDSLSSVSWSADGRTLYAGGTVVVNEDSPFVVIRAWSKGGLGEFRDLNAGIYAIKDIRSNAGGGVVLATGNTWGVFDAAGQRGHQAPATIADIRGKTQDFRISRDGLTVRFKFDYEGKVPARFNLAERRYEAPNDETGLLAPRIRTDGIEVKDWENKDKPVLNGQPLKLDFDDKFRSLVIASDGQSFVLGGDSNLTRFDRNGKVLWRRSGLQSAFAVNISDDNRFVVAALGNGTMRWLRLSDGKDVAIFFPHANQKQWLLISASYYYDASPGAEDLIGWHLNRGKDNAADFFPNSRFRDKFYRPDVVTKIFTTPDVREALRLANLDAGRVTSSEPVMIHNVLPPVIEILSPTEGASVSSPNINLKYSTRTPDDAPVTGLRVRVNGLAVNLPEARNLAVSAAAGPREIAVPVPSKDSEIQLFAENRNGVSVPAVLRVTWTGTTTSVVKEEVLFKPKLYVLAVGVSKYANSNYDLDLPAKDASDFAGVFQRQKGKLYGDVQVRLLTDSKATRDDVVDGLDWLKREVTARDVGIMFLAGHGMNDNTGKYYFLPHNADPSKLLRTGVPQTDIKDTLNMLAGKALFFVDSCHSGNALGTAKTRGIGSDTNAFVNELASAENGVVVFTASTGRQLSQEDTEWGNGAFTKAVVEGLSGKADFQRTGKITHKGLDYYVAERVKELTKGTQSPVSIVPQGITDFPIAVIQ